MPRVILIEDDQFVRKAVMRAFRDQVEIVAFGTLQEAEAHLDERWDGMIIDRQLPDGDGLAFAVRIKDRNPNASIVLFSGEDPRDLAAQTAQHGIAHADKADGVRTLTPIIEMWMRIAEGSGSGA